MSPRKTILRELSRAREQDGSEIFTRPDAIAGFSDRPADYQKAVNKLLQDRLIEGRTDDDGRMAIAVNDHRLPDVQKEIRPLWAHPTLWLSAAVIVVAVFGLVGA